MRQQRLKQSIPEEVRSQALVIERTARRFHHHYQYSQQQSKQWAVLFVWFVW